MALEPASRRRFRLLGWILGALAALLVAGLLAFRLSPWPSALVIRYVFERGGAATNAALAAYVPSGVVTQSALQYDPEDPAALLDIHRPASAHGRALPVVLWVHGGGFIAGHRGEIANYARILAADGYAVAVMDYALAPGAKYPRPVRQVGLALAYLARDAERLQLDPQRIVLAGDSAGAQLAAQVAALASSPEYASATGLAPDIARRQLRGAVLFCGPHDALLMGSQARTSWFLRTVMWSYLGSATPSPDLLKEFSVVPHVTADFPPTLITVGNDDPLAPQSHALAGALRQRGVVVDALFYPAAHQPPLGHEYQFDLSRPESREVLRRTRAFLREVTRSVPPRP